MTTSLRASFGRWAWVLPPAMGLVLMAGPWWGLSTLHMRNILLVSLLALVVSGLNLAWGFGGELAIGQVAMYATGAYVTAWMALHGYDMAWSLLASLLAVAVLGTLTALPGLRISGWGVAMCSFFLVVLIPKVVDLLEKYTGGLVGQLGIPDPVLFGRTLSPNAFYVLVVGCLTAWLLLMRNLVRGRHGVALLVMRESPILARSLGYSVTRLKATAYVVGAFPAGVAGWLYAYLDRYVSPNYFGFEFAILVTAAAVLGGAQTVYGAVLGAAILQLGPNEIDAFEQYTFVVYGAFLLIGGIVFTSERYQTWMRRVQRWLGLSSPMTVPRDAPGEEMPHVAGARLSIAEVSKSFGGVKALDSVTLTAEPGRITGLIGANGSGKTTLLNIVSGFYAKDAGEVRLGDQVLTGLSAERTARQGVSRTFQTPIIPRSMTVGEVVASARYRREYAGVAAAMLRLPAYRRIAAADSVVAAQWLRAVGLADLADAEASGVALGIRRQVEVARALATGANLLLLDEPASGLSTREVDELSRLLLALRDAGATIVLVEHNFEMVTSVADHIYVLERGVLIAEGTPDEIRVDEAVAVSYLGAEIEAVEAVQAAATEGAEVPSRTGSGRSATVGTGE